MALEIPGIYVRTDLGKLYVFDHVEAEIMKSDKRENHPTYYEPHEVRRTSHSFLPKGQKKPLYR